MATNNVIFAIILAAGQAKRMHQSKITLPWGNGTVISHIIFTLQQAGISEIVVVTGGYREQVEAEVAKTVARPVYNPDYANDEMTISLKVGLNSIELDGYSAGLITLGDQPNIFADDIQKLYSKHRELPERIVIPSYSFRRGHPWLIPNRFFDELKLLKPPDTMRSFLNKYSTEIEYVNVSHAEILIDLDTPQDYEKHKPD